MDATADRTSVVIDADPAALSSLRADVARWLQAHDHDPDVAERAVLVVSELAQIAIGGADPAHPLVAELRQTHSLLVVEVSCHVAPGGPLDGISTLASSADVVDLRIVEHVADRVLAAGGGARVTLSSTFHLTS
jgi:hypothetical protein